MTVQPEREVVRVTGRLTEANFRRRTAEIWDDSDRKTAVVFPESLASEVADCLRARVMAVGELGRSPRSSVLHLDQLLLLDPERSWAEFRRHQSTEELVRRQGVRRIASVREMTFSDPDPDEAEAAVEEMRRIRRGN